MYVYIYMYVSMYIYANYKNKQERMCRGVGVTDRQTELYTYAYMFAI